MALALLIPMVMLAQASPPPPPPLRIAASSFASVEVHLNARRIGNRWFEEDASLSGPSRIVITYGQPHARGRKVEGGLIPLDTVWRFGANMATTLHTDLDITLGDLNLPRGDYSLFILYARQIQIAERSEEHTSELQSPCNLVCRLLLEKKNITADHDLHR